MDFHKRKFDDDSSTKTYQMSKLILIFTRRRRLKDEFYFWFITATGNAVLTLIILYIYVSLTRISWWNEILLKIISSIRFTSISVSYLFLVLILKATIKLWKQMCFRYKSWLPVWIFSVCSPVFPFVCSFVLQHFRQTQRLLLYLSNCSRLAIQLSWHFRLGITSYNIEHFMSLTHKLKSVPVASQP